MKIRTVFYPLIILCFLSTLQPTLRAAPDISQWHLPDGAIARLGKGTVNQIAYSADGKHLAVVSDIGVWIYDASTGTEQALLTKHTGRAVLKVGFSPDGQTLAVTGDRQELQLWDTRTWTLNGTLDKDGNWPTDFAFSPDGNTIAVADLGQTTELWDVSTIRFKCTLEDSADPHSEGTGLFFLAFSPNGDTVAIGSNPYGTVQLWETSTGTLKQTFIGEITPKEGFSFSPDGNTLATRSFTNTVLLWDTITGKLKQTLDGIGNDLGVSIAYSPDGKMLAIPGWGGLQLWNTETDEHKQTLEQSEEIESFAFSPDGRTIAALCAQQRKVWYDDSKTSYTYSIYHTVSLWSTATLQRKSTLETTDSVESIVFHPDGNTIATMNADNTVQVWDVATGELIYTLEHTGGIVGISYNLETPGTFMTAHKDKMTRVWDTGTHTRKHTFRLTEHTDALNSAAFSPDGRTLATASLDGSVQLWDATTGMLKETLIGRKYTDESAYPAVGPFSPDGDTIVVNLGGAVQLLGSAPARVKRMIRISKYIERGNGLSFWVRSIAYSPDGNTIAAGMDENTVMLWDTRTEEHTHTFKHFSEYESTVHGVAFSPDGSALATANISKILLSDTSTWTLKQHTYDIDYCQLYYNDISIALVYSPDGKTLAHGCNGTVLWDPLTGVLKHKLAGHAGAVTSITYHPDGNILATAGQDGTVLLWDLTSHHLNPPKEE